MTDNNNNIPVDPEADSLEQDPTIQWLLEQEYEDRPEQLFPVQQDKSDAFALTDLEADIAARPMTSDGRNLDDLSSVVTEEIVVGAAGGFGGDIYQSSETSVADESGGIDTPRAINFAGRMGEADAADGPTLEDGADILGLSDVDDIGEQFLVIKKNPQRKATPGQAGSSAKAVESPELSQVETRAGAGDTSPKAEVSEVAASAVEGAVGDEVEPVTGESAAEPVLIQVETRPVPDVEEALAPVALESQDSVVPDRHGSDCSGTDLEPTMIEVPDLDPSCFALEELDLGDAEEADQWLDLAAMDVLESEAEQEQAAPGEVDPVAALESGEAVSRPAPGDAEATSPARAGVVSGPDSVLDYVAAEKAPAEEQAFDQYLLQGNHLAIDDEDIDELEVEQTNGVVSVDPDIDASIDYHQDFAINADDPEEALPFNIRVARMMASLEAAVTQRLAQLGLAADAVQAEVTLGSDTEALVRCVEEGYVSVEQIGMDLDEHLDGCSPVERGEIHVRLYHTATGKCWNALLDPGFAPPGDNRIEEVAPADGFEGEIQAFDTFDADEQVLLEDASEAVEVQFDGLVLEDFADDDVLDILAAPVAAVTDDAVDASEAAALVDTAEAAGPSQEETVETVAGCAAEEGQPTEADAAAPSEAPDSVDSAYAVAGKAWSDSDGEVSQSTDSGVDFAAESVEDVPPEASADGHRWDENDPDMGEALFELIVEPLPADDDVSQVDEPGSAENKGEDPLPPSETAPEGGRELDIVAEEAAEAESDRAPDTRDEGEPDSGGESQAPSPAERPGAPAALTLVEAPEPPAPDPLGALEGLDEFESDLDPGEVDVEGLWGPLADDETGGDDLYGAAVEAFAASEEAVRSEPATVAAVPGESGESSAWCIPEGINFSRTEQAGGELFADFLDAFIEEAASELDKLEDSMAAWEADPVSEQAFAPVPRILHTLKGIAKGVGLQTYGTLIHNFETLIESLSRPDADGREQYFAILNAWLDAAVSGFEHVRDQRSDIAAVLPTQVGAPPAQPAADPEPAQPASEQGLLDSEDQTAEVSSPAVEAPSEPATRIPAQPTATAGMSEKQIADEGAKVLAAQQQTIRMTPDAVDRLLSLSNQAQQLGVRASQATLRGKGAAAELQGRLTSVRSHIAKIADRALANVTAMGNRSSTDMDALEMDQYSELQEAANILREGVEDLDDLINLSSKQNMQIEALLKQQATVLSFLGSSIQGARVVPISRLMPGLRRIVRTVSADLGKPVQFKVINETGSLDRDNHARCQIILEHMVRNALDHGIEPAAERIAVGKPSTGIISIEVSKDGSDYLVRLRDDGRGIDPHVMRETAFAKGLDVDVDALSDEEALRLIFHKGFSTAVTVSEISGRGVGMDVVLHELQAIGGDIDIQSEVGKGTTFVLRIPSNVTMNGALLVSAGSDSYAIPLDGLIAIEHVESEAFYQAVTRREKLELFGLRCEPSYLATLCHGESLPERNSWGSTVPVILAGSEDRCMAIAVDDVKQALELVIRSLGVQFQLVPGVAGAATTADGQAIVALDLNALVSSLSPEEQSTLSVESREDERMLVLVVDDSRTQRLVATSRFDSLGVETVTAENGLVAMEFLNTTHRLPDVVLLDVEMPVKDGIQTLRDIRNSPKLVDLPVIMVTSRTGAKHRALAEEAGCNGYMGKPFNFPVLVEMIAELTQRELQLG